MSLATWEAEYYPIPADRIAASAAIEHSIQKWEGLRPKNLKRHGLVRTECGDAVCEPPDDGVKFYINQSSCALCACHFQHKPDTEEGYEQEPCNECPLYEALDFNSCDFGSRSPYVIWLRTGNPKPMLVALKKALKIQQLGMDKLKKIP